MAVSLEIEYSPDFTCSLAFSFWRWNPGLCTFYASLLAEVHPQALLAGDIDTGQEHEENGVFP